MIKRITAIFIALVLLFSLCACDNSGEKSSYYIEASYKSESKTIEVSESVHFVATENTEKAYFNVYANAYREGAKYPPITKKKYFDAFENGESYGAFNVKSVTVDGEAAEYNLCGKDKNLLEVKLNRTLNSGESAEIMLEFSVTLSCVAHRTGYTSHAVNLGNFYPILAVNSGGAPYECTYYPYGDPFYSEKTRYDVKFTCEDKYVVASGGALKSKTTENGEATYSFSGDLRSFSLVLSEKFFVRSERVGGVNVLSYAENEERAKTQLEVAVNALKFYQKKLGDYAHDTLSIVSTALSFGGMEYSGLCMISKDAQGAALNEIVAHEVAHEFFYSAVGVNESENAFIDEGLSQYLTIAFLDENREYGNSREKMLETCKANLASFFDLTESLAKKSDRRIKRPLGEFQSEFEYTFFTYVYAVVMFDDLREQMGDKRFFRALKLMYERYNGKIIDETDLYKCFDEAAGYEVSKVIAAYLNGKAA